MSSSLEPKLDRLMEDYKEACPDPEPTTGFLPNLWTRIDARRLFDRHARRWTSAYVTIAVILCFILAVLLSLQAARTTDNTYIDVLDDNQDSSAAIVEAGGGDEAAREKK